MYVVVLITCPDEESAARISNTLLDMKLIACSNMIPSMKSVFWWHGKKHGASEVLLMLKTREALVKKIVRSVKKIHPYSVPEIIAIPIVGGNKGYTRWIEEETGE